MMGVGNQPTTPTGTGTKTSSNVFRNTLSQLGFDENSIQNAIVRGVAQGIISAKKGGSIRSIKLPSHITDRLKNKVRH
jgi:DNA-binding transcriptional regulator PaaX